MNILYGVCGEGFGHSSRALVIGKYLESKGYRVVIVTYGQAYKVLKNKFKIFKIKGAHMIFREGILKKRKTLIYNLKNFSSNIRKSKKIYRLMKELKPELCISDMEPVVPILSNWYRLPLISIDNQHRFSNLKINVPKKYKKDYLMAKEVVNLFVRRAKYFIVTSFADASVKESKKNTIIIPPIIREDVKNLKPKYGNQILVYLNKADRKVLDVLGRINEKFVIYGYDVKRKKGNLEFKTRESFLKELNECKAIIATSGFTLISEAIYLRKPYLALPLKGQFEQVFNSLFLKKAGFGEYSEELNEKEVLDFLSNLDKYKIKLRSYNPDYDKLFKALDSVLREV